MPAPTLTITHELYDLRLANGCSHEGYKILVNGEHIGYKNYVDDSRDGTEETWYSDLFGNIYNSEDEVVFLYRQSADGAARGLNL